MVEDTSEKIVSLQALRGIAFIGIFLGHSSESYVEWSALGVSIFFILSGFLLEFRFNEIDLKQTIRGNLRFAINKIFKLYPLHIVTMGAFFLLYVTRLITYSRPITEYGKLCLEIIPNGLLVQTWFPIDEIYISLNGVSWFLSVMLFLYFMFPYIHEILKKLSNKLGQFFSITGVILFGAIISVVLYSPLMKGGVDYWWATYVFPVFRIGDFFIGCVLGMVIKDKCKLEGDKQFDVIVSIEEVLLLVFSVVIYYFYFFFKSTSEIIVALQSNPTTMWIPCGMMWVIVFYYKKGFFSILMTNKFFIWVGNLSPYLFLIHFVVINYICGVLSVLGYTIVGISSWFWTGVEFIVSVLCTLVYIKIEKKVMSKWKRCGNDR